MPRVIIVGVGGIGSRLADWVAQYLHSFHPDSVLTIVDGDAYEDKNRDRQKFKSLGSKADVTATTLTADYPGLKVEVMAEYLKPDNIDFVLTGGEIVLVCVDNHKTRKLISETAGRLDEISIISGGNELNDGDVLIYLRREGRDLTPSLTQDNPEIANPADKAPYEMSCEELARAGVRQILPTNISAASHMLNAFHQLLTDPSVFVSKNLGSEENPFDIAYTKIDFDIRTGRAMSRKFAVKAVTTEHAQGEQKTEAENAAA